MSAKYKKDLPRRMYTYFVSYDGAGVPSFSKFARSIGVTLHDLTLMRAHPKFDEAYLECNEIRRDYLIDQALAKRYDSSFTRFLLSAEYGMGEDDGGANEPLKVTVEVVE